MSINFYGKQYPIEGIKLNDAYSIDKGIKL